MKRVRIVSDGLMGERTSILDAETGDDLTKTLRPVCADIHIEVGCLNRVTLVLLGVEVDVEAELPDEDADA